MFEKDYLLITFTILCMLIIIALAVFIIYVVSRYQKKFMSYLLSLDELKISHENEILMSQVEMQEQTFQNIAREIHDNVGQKLSLAKLYLMTLKKKNSNIENIKECIDIIGLAISDLRDMSRTMSADMILENGFINALELEVSQVNKAQAFEIILSIQGELTFLAERKELILFRIVQEALHNIIKHARATVIKIHLIYFDSMLHLSIHDNGRGFDDISAFKEGQGLLNMKKRAEMLNGELKIQSDEYNGTNFTLKIPTNEQAN